eukprot:gnl/Spiro4/16240_TR8722_c0_g1_i1.p1 gnl/Spiro4/16240_TR8722_c0_g1~~gnl/Spiro4/16240_TR8722_c0_g1_i1.p1  ORF type:complete len:439 (+),score=144.39 gnl/Spiro4/16240_TR8722_c0_g1_i1:55-1371(+)
MPAGVSNETQQPLPQQHEPPAVLKIGDITYDISEFAKIHPGGNIIRSYQGRDATDVFMAFHSKEARAFLRTLPAASSDSIKMPPPPQQRLLDDFRVLRADLEKEGLLDASLWWYPVKTLTTLAIGAAGIWLAWARGWTVLGALLLGLCWQQMGWLAHEIAHHCWFKNRKLGHSVTLVLANALQGFDLFWWSDRHNQHHATPNVLGGHDTYGDPDVDNLPVVAWDESDLPRVATWPPWAKRLIRWQAYYFLFVMPTLRLVWALQSIKFSLGMATSPNPVHRRYATLTRVSLALFWLWQFALVCAMPSSWGANVAFFLISNLAGGAGIALVVFFSHHSLDKVAANDDIDNFVTVQLPSTRNMNPSPFVDWLWGGLNYQIEHHLFPTAPRHNLSRIRPRVQELLARHALPYNVDSFCGGVSQMLSHLHAVAAKLPLYDKSQ